MSAASVNGRPVYRARVRLPRQGLWIADVAVDSSDGLTGQVVLELPGGRVRLTGTAKRTGTFAEAVYLRIVPGAAGMGKEVEPKFYRQPTGRVVAQDILSAVGEKLSDKSSTALLDQQIPTAHCRLRGSAAAALTTLCDRLGAIWRSLPDGTVWIGAERWDPAKVEDLGDLLADDPRAQRSEYGVEDPSLLPGVTVDGRKVSIVEHTVSSAGCRTQVWWETGDGSGVDRHARAVEALVGHYTARFDFHALYPADVVSQASDGKLSVKPDSDVLPQMTEVPIRWGCPGETAKVSAGRVLVGFEDGDPGSPVAVAWISATVTEVVIPGTTVKLGSSTAAKALALAEKVKSRLDTIQGAFDSHLHAAGTLLDSTTNAVTGSTAVPTTTIGSLAGVDSETVLTDD